VFRFELTGTCRPTSEPPVHPFPTYCVLKIVISSHFVLPDFLFLVLLAWQNFERKPKLCETKFQTAMTDASALNKGGGRSSASKAGENYPELRGKLSVPYFYGKQLFSNSATFFAVRLSEEKIETGSLAETLVRSKRPLPHILQGTSSPV
jgi:hypothetical protein